MARKSFSKLLNSFDKDSLPFGSELLTANLQRSNLDYKDMFELNEILEFFHKSLFNQIRIVKLESKDKKYKA